MYINCHCDDQFLSSRGLGHQVFILVTGVRIPVGMPFFVLNPCTPCKGSPCHPTWYKSPARCHFCFKSLQRLCKGSPCHPTWYKIPVGMPFLIANEDASLHFTRQQPLFTQKAQPFLHIFTSSVSCRWRPIRNSRHINKAHNGCGTHCIRFLFYFFDSRP